MIARLTAMILVTVVAGSAVAARAHDHQQGSLTVVHPWSRATAPSQRAGGVFLNIINTGGEPDRLIGVESDIADRVSLHVLVRDGDVMKMQPLVGGVVVPANGEVELAPGGQHVMLFGLHRQLEQESTLPLTLIFERAGRFEIVAVVEAAGSRGPSDAGTAQHRHDTGARTGK